jgi:hypothetical protein
MTKLDVIENSATGERVTACLVGGDLDTMRPSGAA